MEGACVYLVCYCFSQVRSAPLRVMIRDFGEVAISRQNEKECSVAYLPRGKRKTIGSLTPSIVLPSLPGLPRDVFPLLFPASSHLGLAIFNTLDGACVPSSGTTLMPRGFLPKLIHNCTTSPRPGYSHFPLHPNKLQTSRESSNYGRAMYTL
jgi:hypothetical protein